MEQYLLICENYNIATVESKKAIAIFYISTWENIACIIGIYRGFHFFGGNRDFLDNFLARGQAKC